jgi:hypothetical protein
MHPNPSADTSRLLLPNFRVSIAVVLLIGANPTVRETKEVAAGQSELHNKYHAGL